MISSPGAVTGDQTYKVPEGAAVSLVRAKKLQAYFVGVWSSRSRNLDGVFLLKNERVACKIIEVFFFVIYLLTFSFVLFFL